MSKLLIPFSKRYSGEFLNREETNFDLLLEKIGSFYAATRIGIRDGKVSRRQLNLRLNYEDELQNVKMNQKGITTEEVALEFNDMLAGCIRQNDPTAAFNIIPTPLFDSIAALTLTSLYNPNPCWDFISGKFCLYEKKTIRALGSLVGWSHADGFVVTGGKQALIYAIKSGIGRANQTNPKKMDSCVVLCSALAHYCIEHVCSYLGLNPENCLRVNVHPTGEIDLHDLKMKLENCISQGKKIGTVIGVGGATINLVPDPILSIKNILDEVKKQHGLDYTPYLHVDSVITWTWLAFKENSSYLSESLEIVRKIEQVLSKLVGIQYADSFAADFHKTGLCPYAAGVFITKEPTNLKALSSWGYLEAENPHFGELEPLRYTLENSRSGLSIASIWIAIRRLGLEGLREFVLYQLTVSEIFKEKIRLEYSEHFEILNCHSNGWEIVLKPHFQRKLLWDDLQNSSTENQEEYVKACYGFVNTCWYSPFEQEELKYPVIGFIPKYSRKGTHEKSFPALLIHPTSLHYDEKNIQEMLEEIFKVKVTFDLRQHENMESSSKEETLYTMTPPR